jgi:hypothetical protein
VYVADTGLANPVQDDKDRHHFVSEANLAEGWDPVGFADWAGRSRDLPAERSEEKRSWT